MQCYLAQTEELLLLLRAQIQFVLLVEFVLTTATKNAEEPQKLVASMPTVAPLVTSVRSGSFSEDVMLDETKKERTKSLTR